MSISIIPYQPLPFDVEEHCTLPCANWVQKIERTDITSIQFGFGACPTAATMVVGTDYPNNGSDWNILGSWTFNAGIATAPPDPNGGSIGQTIEMLGVDYVEITFNLTLSNGFFFVGTDTGILEQVNFGGTKTFVFPVTGDTLFTFLFNEPLGGSISNIIIKPINTRVQVAVTELDTTLITVVPTNWFTFSDGFLTVNFEDWDSLALDDGCYRLAVLDPCECSQDGFMGDNFRIPNQFVAISGAFTLDGSGGMVSNELPNNQTQVRSRALICPDIDYEFEYTVSGLDGANGDYFEIRIGTTTGAQRTVDGTYSETLSTNVAGDIEVRYIFNHGTAAQHQITLSGFSMVTVDPIISHMSVDFNLKDTHKCSVLIDACGVGEEFNFGFNNTGFNPIIRLEGTYRTSNYPTTRTAYEYSTGEKRVPYMRTRRAKTFLFGAPSYVMDWSTLWLGLSNVAIDGVAKFCEDDEPPTISPEEDVDFGVVTFTFSDRIELTEKRSCTTLPNVGCEDEGAVLSIQSSGGFVLDLPVLSTGGRVMRFNV